MKKTLSSLAVVACLLSPLAANAASIPYADSGTQNPILYSFTAMSTGHVDAYFYGSGAGYTNTISMLVNGLATPESALGVLDNHASTIGQVVNLGSVTAGDVLIFRLNVLTTGQNFYSTMSMNSDGVNHVYSTAFSGDSQYGIPEGTFLAFEDMTNGGDLNYNDEKFVFTNVAAAVPEPESYAMLMFGFGLLGVIASRKKNSKEAV